MAIGYHLGGSDAEFLWQVVGARKTRSAAEPHVVGFEVEAKICVRAGKRDDTTKVAGLLSAWIERSIRSQAYRLMLSNECYQKHIGTLEEQKLDALALLGPMDGATRKTRSVAMPDKMYHERRSRLILAQMQLDSRPRAWGHLRHAMKMRPHVMEKAHLLDVNVLQLYKNYCKRNDDIRGLGVKQGIAEIMAAKDLPSMTPAIREHIIADQQAIIESTDPLMDPRALESARLLLQRWQE